MIRILKLWNPTASPPLAIMTQSPTGEELIFSLNCVNIMTLYFAGAPAPAGRQASRQRDSARSGHVPYEV